MTKTKHHPQVFLIAIVSVTMLWSLVGAPRQNSNVNFHDKLHPALIENIKTVGNNIVSVIVTKNQSTETVEAFAKNLGGQNFINLNIINAFAVDIPAKALADLSAHPMVKWISPDKKVENNGTVLAGNEFRNTFLDTIGQSRLSSKLDGNDIGVAVIDSGVVETKDLETKIPNISINGSVKECDFGHGTAMAGVIAGKGNGSPNSDKNYRGVATGAKVIDVKVSDCKGQGRISQVIEGLQWVLENQKKYKIRIVNISLNAEKSESYHNSPLAAAVEVLWFNKIVVIVSAGNVADGNLYPPANDPFVITVGALDEKGTQSLADDVVASFSGYGATSDGVQKPDLVAPGVNIVATQMKNSYLWQNHPRNVVSGKDEKNNYIRMSGTSMAAAIVSGAVAILLKVEPNLTPDQVKYRLKATARPIGNGVRDGAGSLDLYKAINTKTTASANTGTPVSRLLASSMQNIGPSVSWNSVSWNSVSWNSVSWNSVSWNSVSWNSLSQDSVTWNSTVWE